LPLSAIAKAGAAIPIATTQVINAAIGRFIFFQSTGFVSACMWLIARILHDQAAGMQVKAEVRSASLLLMVNARDFSRPDEIIFAKI